MVSDVAFTSAPGPDEFELSIFGPGKGECVALHLGGGDWFIVDSCREYGTRQQPALAYLDALGVNIETAVKLVVGTHAHDDHVKGLAEVYRRSTSAKFVCSSAVTSHEFFQGLEVDDDIASLIHERVRYEYSQIMDDVTSRDGVALLRGLEKRVLWERGPVSDGQNASIMALSPSDKAVTRSIRYLAEGLAKPEDRAKLANAEPNDFSVALWAEYGGIRLLLGADLENGPDGCGWRGVLEWFNPSTSAQIFKVPHHGSENAHHDDVWSQLLTTLGGGPISFLTPFRGAKRLPSDDDIARLKARSSLVGITASPKTPAASRGARKTAASLSGVATNVREPWGKCGQISIRSDSDLNSPELRFISPAASY